MDHQLPGPPARSRVRNFNDQLWGGLGDPYQPGPLGRRRLVARVGTAAPPLPPPASSEKASRPWGASRALLMLLQLNQDRQAQRRQASRGPSPTSPDPARQRPTHAAAAGESRCLTRPHGLSRRVPAGPEGSEPGAGRSQNGRDRTISIPAAADHATLALVPTPKGGFSGSSSYIPSGTSPGRKGPSGSRGFGRGVGERS